MRKGVREYYDRTREIIEKKTNDKTSNKLLVTV